jgi:hypothetical protein
VLYRYLCCTGGCIRETSNKESLAREIATLKDEPMFERHLVIEELRARLSKKPELLAQVVEEM